MQVCLYVALDGFYISALRALEPELSNRPLVVFDEGLVLDSCPHARLRKILPGTRMSEAKTVLREEGVYQSASVDVFRPFQREWLDRCLDVSDVIEPDTASAAWIDLTGHPKPAEVGYSLVKSLTYFPFPARFGLSISKWVAKQAAVPIQYEDSPCGIPQIELINDPGEYLSGLPTMQLHPVSTAHRERLVFLGYRRIGKVARAPQSLLREQFGKDAFWISKAAQGKIHEFIKPIYPDKSIVKMMRFEPELNSRLTLSACMAEIAGELAFSLNVQDMLASHLRVTVEFSDGTKKSFGRPLGKPIQEATPMRAACQYGLDQIPMDQNVASLQVKLSDLKRSTRVQRSFDHRFNPAEQDAMVSLAKKRISTSYGEKAVVRATELSVPRRVKLLRAWQHATGWH